ncbi:AAA family ATPase [Brumimicrobium mesophilum]|uniref:AAA family ATPase n=1 Tax=Brumimicrobium mesophilum TaxID=392717 RepID=UPI000D13EF53|nr:AAA family ATPase [Brumimicrobium mesophilum]
MDLTSIKTYGELENSGYSPRSIKDELRGNLIEKLKNKTPIFEGIIGYEDTVIPQIISAILSKHDINLLGLRGQAKTRIARTMVDLLDEYIPIIKGSEINDDPFCPISHFGISEKADKGGNLPIEWLHRNDRFYEKLATPDVTVADLIGDIDPIKAATLKLSYADERVIHYGMIPRANRSIFVINEIPDLQARIQVALFNILQEGDIQIRGFKMRLPLDVNFIFTANPEDYTNRGSIVTPLKDRIGSQILTHYPKSIEIAKKITQQEVISDVKNENILVPETAKTLLEQIVFEARKSPYIDANSGVSARMSISMYENLVSAAELRMLKNGQSKTTVRMSDFENITPAITGKVELVYEGEQLGIENVANELIGSAVKTTFNSLFRSIKKLKKPGSSDEFDAIVQWFMESNDFELKNDSADQKHAEQMNKIKPLEEALDKFISSGTENERIFLKELMLWGMVEYKLLAKRKREQSTSFFDEIVGSFYEN